MTQRARRRLVRVRLPQLLLVLVVGTLALTLLALTDRLNTLIGAVIGGLILLLTFATSLGLQDSQREIEDCVDYIVALLTPYPTEMVHEALALAASRWIKRDALALDSPDLNRAVPARIIVLWSLAKATRSRDPNDRT